MMTSDLRAVENVEVQRTRSALVQADVTTAVAFMAMPVDEVLNTARAVLAACDDDLPHRALALLPTIAKAKISAAMKMLDACPEALLGDREIAFIAKLVEMALKTSWPADDDSVSAP